MNQLFYSAGNIVTLRGILTVVMDFINRGNYGNIEVLATKGGNNLARPNSIDHE